MLSKYVVRAQSPGPSVSSELGTIYLVCGEHNFELKFFFNCFLLFLGISVWEWHLQCPGGCVCDSGAD